MSSQSNSLGNFRINSPNTNNNAFHISNTDQAGANWAQAAINRGNLKTVTNLRWLIGHMYRLRAPSRWYRGGRREIMKKINSIRNKRVTAARTAAANLSRLRSVYTPRGVANRETGVKRRRRT
jgi:hypothetical protein